MVKGKSSLLAVWLVVLMLLLAALGFSYIYSAWQPISGVILFIVVFYVAKTLRRLVKELVRK